jgi:hypothetical protein
MPIIAGKIVIIMKKHEIDFIRTRTIYYTEKGQTFSSTSFTSNSIYRFFRPLSQIEKKKSKPTLISK